VRLDPSACVCEPSSGSSTARPSPAHVFRFCVLYHKAHRADLLGHGWALVWGAEIQPFAIQTSVSAFFKASYVSASTALAKSCGASWGRLWPTTGITRCS